MMHQSPGPSLASSPPNRGEVIARYGGPAPRYTSYPSAAQWTDLSAEAAREAVGEAMTGHEAVAIYVHVPFCEQMCWYCGCNVVATKSRDRVPRYLSALQRELNILHDLVGSRDTAQLHFGGGTPTFLSPRELEDLTRCIWRLFPPRPEAEVGVEVDPAVTTVDHLEALAACGFNRLSVGVQDVDEKVLAHCGRPQTFAQVRAVVEHARRLGFRSINADLLYGLPGQTPAHLQRSASAMADLGVDRVAVFGYAHVPSVKPNQRRLELFELPNQDLRWELAEAAKRTLLARGYVSIGFDHYARDSDELARAARHRRLHRNFQGYTVLEPMPLLGVGVSAISELDGTFAQNHKVLSKYLEAIERGNLATSRGYRSSEDDRLRGRVIRSIMCNLAVRWDEVGVDSGQVAEKFAAELMELRAFQEDGLLEVDARGVSVTEAGRPVLRAIAQVFDAYRTSRTPLSHTV